MDGWDQELIVPAETVDFLALRGVGHEIGHIIAAAHYQAYVFGMGLGFLPERRFFFIQAIYRWETCPIDTQCIVKAAGPPADLLYRGAVDDAAASGDLADIANMTGVQCLEPYLSEAVQVLKRYEKEMTWASILLRTELLSGKERTFTPLPNGKLAAILVDREQLDACPD